MRLKSAIVAGTLVFISSSLVGQTVTTSDQRANNNGSQYHVVRTLYVDSGDAWFIAVDSEHRRLYGADRAVIDIDRDSVIGQLPAGAGHGYTLATDLGIGITRRGLLFDLVSLQSLRTLPVTAHSLAYDKSTHRAFFTKVAAGDSGETLVFDVPSGHSVGRVPLPKAHPDVTIADGEGTIYVSMPDAGAVNVVDARTLQLRATWSLGGCQLPRGLSIDAPGHRLFVSCLDVVAVVDTRDGRIVQEVPVSDEAQQNAFDASARLILNPTGRGTMTVIHQDGPDAYSIAGTVSIADSASIVAVDAKSHHAFLVFAQGKGVRVVVMAP